MFFLPIKVGSQMIKTIRKKNDLFCNLGYNNNYHDVKYEPKTQLICVKTKDTNFIMG